MIITLTGNLLAERTFVCDGWTAERTQRATAESFQVGGKGVNVAKMLRRIGEDTTTWCFLGGAAGEECRQWLEANRLPHRAFLSQTPTRSGLVVRSESARETTFLGPDRMVDATALEACAEALDRARLPGAFLALCGSFPGWETEAARPLRDAVARWAAEGVLAADTYGPPLRWGLEQPLTLVKINRLEFDALFSNLEQQEPVTERIERALQRWPVRSWIVTDGGGPVFFGEDKGTAHRILPPSIDEISSTGSGDVLFACVLAARLSRKMSLSEAVRFALPYASANAAHPGVAEFDLNNLPTLRSFQP